MSEHTPEPWLVNFNSMSVPTISAEYERIALVDTCGGDGPANARRIVACVNACAGIETESLEADGYGDNWAEIRRQRDAFHAAEMAWERAMMAAIGEDGIKSVSDAIAKLKAERNNLSALLSSMADFIAPIADDMNVPQYGLGRAMRARGLLVATAKARGAT